MGRYNHRGEEFVKLGERFGSAQGLRVSWFFGADPPTFDEALATPLLIEPPEGC
jgi:hypothetical protein